MSPARILALILAAFAACIFGTFTDRPGMTFAGWLVIIAATLAAWSKHRAEVTR